MRRKSNPGWHDQVSRQLTVPAGIAAIAAFLGLTVFEPVTLQNLFRWEKPPGQYSSGEMNGAKEKGGATAENDRRTASRSLRQKCTLKAVEEMANDRGLPVFLQKKEACLAKGESEDALR